MDYEDFLTLLEHDKHHEELHLRLFEVANSDPEFRYLLLKAVLESELTQDVMLDIGGHYIDDMDEAVADYDPQEYADFKREGFLND